MLLFGDAKADILHSGQEIENPFGYEENDLDLDGFCLGIQRSLHEITAVWFLPLSLSPTNYFVS
ncbi:hypothetical protein FRC20_006496 [Serendipita sp. 405]|nr:hypothetical protein FRC20_006496 [Serendipita sp. 405]